MLMAPKNQDQWPVIQPGFEHIQRFWDSKHQLCSARLNPGEYYATHQEEIITTVLGSCVTACVFDPYAKVGGMNHFMLPGCSSGKSNTGFAMASKFGIYAMEYMLNAVLKLGGSKDRLEVKLFGGANVIDAKMDVGQNNIEFALEYVHVERLNVLIKDLGGPHPRKLVFFPCTGKVLVKKLRALQSSLIEEKEQAYGHALEEKPAVSQVELF